MYRHEEIAQLITDKPNLSYQAIKHLAKKTLKLTNVPSNSTIVKAKRIAGYKISPHHRSGHDNGAPSNLSQALKTLLGCMRSAGVKSIVIDETGEVEMVKHDCFTVTT